MIIELHYKKIRTGKQNRWYALVSCECPIHEGGKERLIASYAAKSRSPKYCNKCRCATRSHSEETRRKISSSGKGRKAWNKGIPHTQETRIKISNGGLGIKKSEQARKNISFAKIGSKNPQWNPNREEVKIKKKISIAACAMIGRSIRDKNSSVAEVLGYSTSELRKHLESLWEPWMNWDNYGDSKTYIKNNKRTWQIDHIKPCHKFVEEGVIDSKIINALSNLRPLDSIDNIKRNKNTKYAKPNIIGN